MGADDGTNDKNNDDDNDDNDKKMPADMIDAAVEPVVVDGMAVADIAYDSKIPTASAKMAAEFPKAASAAVFAPIDDDDYDDYIVAEADARPLASSAHWPAQATRVDPPPVSSLLYEWCRQGCDWEGVVSWVTDCPEEASCVIAPLDRTPLHEACRNDAPLVVVESLLAAHAYAASARDKSGNAPLHLVFAPASPIVVPTDASLEMTPPPTPPTPPTPYQLLDSEREEIVILLIQHDPGAAMTPNSHGCTPLHLACGNDTVLPSTVAALVQVCPSMASWKDEEGRIPLARYCGAGGQNVQVARILLDAHAKGARDYDSQGRTPLLGAALYVNFAMVNVMLQYDPDAIGLVDAEGRTALHLACQGCTSRAPAGGSEARGLQVLRLLVALCPSLVTVPGGPTAAVPLHYACAARHASLAVVQLLLETDATCASMVDCHGYTPLHTACENAAAVEAEIVPWLLEANPAMAAMLTKKQDTPLHLAAASGRCSGGLAAMEAVEALLNVNVDAAMVQNEYGYTPLHCACTVALPSLGVVKLLMRRCPDGVRLTTHSNDWALHLACQNAHVGVEIVQAMLEQHRQQHSWWEEMRNKDGNTPLHEACFRTSATDVIAALAQWEPRWIGWTNGSGFTPLHLLCKAALLRDAPTVELLLECGRSDVHRILSLVDRTGHNTLHSALHANSCAKVVQAVLRASPPSALVARTIYGDTPLHLACLRGASVQVIEAVVEACCEKDDNASLVVTLNASGRSPLQVLVEDFGAAARKHFRLLVLGGGGGGRTTGGSARASAAAAAAVETALDKVSVLLVRKWGPLPLHAALLARCELGREAIPNSLIQWSLQRHADQVMLLQDGRLPLHLEACVSMKTKTTTTTSKSSQGAILDLLRACPVGAQVRDAAGNFPLWLMMQHGHGWRGGLEETIVAFPPALTWWCKRLELYPFILAKLQRDWTTLYRLVRSKPDLLLEKAAG